MHHINDYFTVPYVEGGRDMSGLDCWGITRLILHYVYKTPLFTSFGHVRSEHANEFTSAYTVLSGQFIPCIPKDGAVACGFYDHNLVHMGVCVDADGQLDVFHTCEKHGPSFMRVEAFKRLFEEVKFYEYAS